VLPGELNETEEKFVPDLPSEGFSFSSSLRSDDIENVKLTKNNIMNFNLINCDQLTISKFFTNKHSRRSIVANIMGFYNTQFFGGFLALRMHYHYGISEEYMGYVFMSSSLPYCIGCIFYPTIFSKVNAKIRFIISFVMAGFAVGIAGTSNVFFLPDDQVWLVYFGLVLHGLSWPFIFITTIPEAIDSMRLKYKIITGIDPELDKKVNDIASLLTIQGLGIACLFGPTFGGYLYDKLGYQNAMTINMFIEFAFALYFAITNCSMNFTKKE
jgi:MFS family permease